MLVTQIHKLIKNAEGQIAKGDTVYMQAVEDNSTTFGKMIEFLNDAEQGEEVEVVITHKARIFAFRTKSDLSVKTLVEYMNGIKTRKVTKAEAPAPAADATAPTIA